jgi:CHAD domain-containing protein
MPAKSTRTWPDSATILERSRGVFFAQWEELLRLRRLVMKTCDPEDIHDLRVASRRFRAALELFGPVAATSPPSELKKSIRMLTRTLGGLRNIDEAQLFFRSRLPSETAPDSALFQSLSEQRDKELKRIEKALTSFDHRDLDRKVRKMVAGLHADCVTERNSISLLAYFSDVSIKKYLPIHQLLAVSTVPEHRDSRHAMRIAIKKWRYFFEIIAPVLDRDYRQFLGLLKEYQSILGQMNDVAVFEVLLNKFRLAPDEREYVDATLLAEDAHLLETFKELLEQKPLSYTFLI